MDSVQRFLVWQWGQPTTFTMNILFLLDLLSFFSLLLNDCFGAALKPGKKKEKKRGGKSLPKLADIYWYCWWQYIYTATKSSSSAEPTFSLCLTKMNANLRALKLYQQTEWETKISLMWQHSGEAAPAMTFYKAAASCGVLQLLGSPQVSPAAEDLSQPNLPLPLCLPMYLSIYLSTYHLSPPLQGSKTNTELQCYTQVPTASSQHVSTPLGISCCFLCTGN